MAFNESEFWFDGKSWILIRSMTTDQLVSIEKDLQKNGLICNKISDESEYRLNLLFKSVYEINKVFPVSTQESSITPEAIQKTPSTPSLAKPVIKAKPVSSVQPFTEPFVEQFLKFPSGRTPT